MQVLHFKNNEALRLEPGMIFTIEPSLAEVNYTIYVYFSLMM
jgi:Xaa-Pro aminopeptidase